MVGAGLIDRLPLGVARQKGLPPLLSQGPAGHGYLVVDLLGGTVEEDDRSALPEGTDAVLSQGEAAAAGDDQSRPAGELLRHLPLTVPEIPLPPLREECGDGAALPGLDEGISVGQLPPQAAGQKPPHGGLAAAHHADENEISPHSAPPS